jgi:hypothetical protein
MGYRAQENYDAAVRKVRRRLRRCDWYAPLFCVSRFTALAPGGRSQVVIN